MTRLILVLMLLAALALAIMAAAVLTRSLARAPSPTEASMPAARMTAFVVLLILLLGLTTGWLGAA